MPSQTKENYLKAIFFLADAEGKVLLSQLSQELGVSTPTANSMVKRLVEMKWVIYEKYKPLILTELGKKAAAMVIRKHRLAEMFLVEKMGFGWEEVHEIAEELEHIDSDAFFERMNQILGCPKIDPHGSPIPDSDGNFKQNNYPTLSQISIGSKVKLRALSKSSKDFLMYLKIRKIELDIEIEVISIEPFDGSMTVCCDQNLQITLSQEVCKRMLVEIS
jgi:DtxR family Mn-dependent transcriptional regulator